MALAAIDIARILGNIEIAPQPGNLARWHKDLSSRPSASA
jgi:hypothetical protein